MSRVGYAGTAHPTLTSDANVFPPPPDLLSGTNIQAQHASHDSIAVNAYTRDMELYQNPSLALTVSRKPNRLVSTSGC